MIQPNLNMFKPQGYIYLKIKYNNHLKKMNMNCKEKERK